jgi:hypothetical protein
MSLWAHNNGSAHRFARHAFFLKVHRLSFPEAMEFKAHQAVAVEKDLVAIVGANEPEAMRMDDSLDLSVHNELPSPTTGWNKTTSSLSGAQLSSQKTPILNRHFAGQRSRLE